MRINPIELYNMLVNSGVLTSIGQITFSFNDVDICVCQRDVVGNIMQEWVEGWLNQNQIEYAKNDNSQMPPDFYLDPDDKTHSLLEVKAFNYAATPGFDIADFRMYEQELLDKPWMLNADYLIFGYEMSDDGTITIKDIWLKKVWEITSCSGDWPLKLQVKRNVVHKMRPCKWYSDRAEFKPFRVKEDFLSAVCETVYRNPATRAQSGTWKGRMERAYCRYSGENLTIRNWDDIKGRYQGGESITDDIEDYIAN